MASHVEEFSLPQSDSLDYLLSSEPVVPFYIHGTATSPRLEWFVDRLRQALTRFGCHECGAQNDEARLVLNLTSSLTPTPVRRNSRAVFVTSIMEGPVEGDAFQTCYPFLIRTLSNVLIYVTANERPDHFRIHGITPERGHFVLDYIPNQEGAFFTQLAERLMPIAASHLIIENEFDCDLPKTLWAGDENTTDLYEVGKRLDMLDLLPAPFNLNELLSPADLRHLNRLYKMGGLSHGNMSQRLDRERFWMSASGVDKSNMREVGRDFLLVKGFSPERQSMLLSVPPNIEPRRVSVDAIEHWMIYNEHPEVGAILHVHAWMDGIPSTEISYPCGTLELARAVAELVRQAEEPARCVVGLKNHGLTITGRSLHEILDRVESRLLKEIPMT